MRIFFKKAITPLLTLAMALGVGFSIASKDVIKVSAADETYTYVTGDGTWVTQNGEREYYSTNFTFNHKKNTGSNIITTAAQLRVYANHSMEIYPTVSGSKVITSMVVTTTSGYTAGFTNATILAGTNPSSTNPVTGVTTTSSLIVTYDFSTIPDIGYVKLTLPSQGRVTTWQIFYEDAVPNQITTLSVSPTAKTYWITDTLAAADFTVNYTKNGAASSGNGSNTDYTARIGTGTGSSFTGTNIIWGTTKPQASDTTIQFRATSDNGAGVYLTADVVLTVNTPTVNSIAISGTMTKKSYLTTGAWDPSGLSVHASLSNGVNEDVTSLVVWSYNPPAPNSTAINSVVVTATYEGKTDNTTQTGIVVTQKVNTLMISEAYGGGGNTGAPFNKDFVEIYNATNNNIDLELDGYYLYYYSATGTTAAASVALSGTILANSYFLVQHNGGTNGVDLPTADQVGPFNMGSTGFKVALTNSITEPSGPTDPSVVDYLGCGTSASHYEGGGAAPAPSNTQSVSRSLDINNVPIDTDNNSADFAKTDPTPQNSALSIVDYVMAANTADQCISRYPVAKARMLATSQGQRDYFESHATDFTTAAGNSLLAGRARYEAWAAYHNDAQPYGTGGGAPMPFIKLTNSAITAIVVIGVIGISIIAVYYFFIKKKRYI